MDSNKSDLLNEAFFALYNLIIAVEKHTIPDDKHFKESLAFANEVMEKLADV